MCDQFANKPQWNRKPSLFTSKKLESIIEPALAPEKCQDVLFICQESAFQNISHSVQMVLMYTQSPEVEHYNNSLLFHYLFIFPWFCLRVSAIDLETTVTFYHMKKG